MSNFDAKRLDEWGTSEYIIARLRACSVESVFVDDQVESHAAG